MKKQGKPLALLLALMLLCATAFGCAKPAPAPAGGTEDVDMGIAGEAPDIAVEPPPIVVTDMAGREVVLASPAGRIVALTAGDCEILYALGAGDRLVGRGAYCDWPAEVLEISAVQSGSETNIEQIIALAPDLLIMTKMAQSEEQVSQLENAGIQVAVSDAQDIEGVYTAIRLIGALLGLMGRAEGLVANMQTAFADLGAKGGDGTKVVYFEVSPLEWGLWTAGSGTFMDEIITMLGYVNCFGDVTGWAEISEEQVLSRNPDYIVTIAMYFGEGPTPAEEIAARPGWNVLAAVQNGAILNLQNNELSRPGPRLVDGARMMSEFFESIQACQDAA